MKSKGKQRKFRKRLARRSATKNCCTVYGLYDSYDQLRYIGQTRLILPDRLNWLFKTIRKKLATGQRLSPVERWASINSDISILPIDENATWNISEIIQIDRARQRGEDLLNILRGGQDTLNDLELSQ